MKNVLLNYHNHGIGTKLYLLTVSDEECEKLKTCHNIIVNNDDISNSHYAWALSYLLTEDKYVAETINDIGQQEYKELGITEADVGRYNKSILDSETAINVSDKKIDFIIYSGIC